MKKVLTALGNPTLNNELKKYERYDVISDDLIYQEAVLDTLERQIVDVLILSGLLQGQNDLVEFVGQIRKKNKLLRIVLITDEIDEETRNVLISKGVFDIFCDNEIDISDITEAVDREEPITRKAEIIKEVAREKYIPTEKVYISKVQKQEIITICGTSGSGKSTVLRNLSKNLSEKSISKILVIDLDTLNGNLDEVFGIDKIPQGIDILLDEGKKCGLNYIADLISKNRFDSNVFEELVIRSGNIDVITGNTSLHFCQNVLKEEYYNKILECAKEKYDFIFIDTSSNIFLDSTKWAIQKASRLFFVTENNYLCIKKANQLLDIFLNVWGIWKNKIQVILNKYRTDDLEVELVQRILGDIEVIGRIRLEEEKEEAPYEKILNTIEYLPRRSLIDRTKEIKKKAAYLLKSRFKVGEGNRQGMRNEVVGC